MASGVHLDLDKGCARGKLCAMGGKPGRMLNASLSATEGQCRPLFRATQSIWHSKDSDSDGGSGFSKDATYGGGSLTFLEPPKKAPMTYDRLGTWATAW